MRALVCEYTHNYSYKFIAVFFIINVFKKIFYNFTYPTKCKLYTHPLPTRLCIYIYILHIHKYN